MITEVGKELGLELHVHVANTADRLPTAFTGDSVEYSTPDAARRFQERCAEIGQELLESSPSGPRNKDTIPNRVLGYGNHAFLIAFPYNVPTQTLTLLWSTGTVDGIPWMPLLPRRKK